MSKRSLTRELQQLEQQMLDENVNSLKLQQIISRAREIRRVYDKNSTLLGLIEIREIFNEGAVSAAKINQIAAIVSLVLRSLRLHGKQKQGLNARRDDQETRPSENAAFLFTLILSKEDQPLLGDLEERFHEEILPRFGVRRARFWFWIEVFKVIGTRNAICKWLLRLSLGGGVAKLGEWVVRKIVGG